MILLNVVNTDVWVGPKRLSNWFFSADLNTCHRQV